MPQGYALAEITLIRMKEGFVLISESTRRINRILRGNIRQPSWPYNQRSVRFITLLINLSYQQRVC